MKLYVRSRMTPRVSVLFALFAVSLILVGRAHLYLPSFVTSITQATPIAVIIACAISTVIMFSLRGGYPLLEARSPRHIPTLDLAIVACDILAFSLIAAFTHGCAPALMIARALIGFSASALIVIALVDFQIGIVVPGILFIVFTLFGAQSDGSGAAWAFAISDVDVLPSWIIVVGLSLAGSYTWVRHYPGKSE